MTDFLLNLINFHKSLINENMYIETIIDNIHENLHNNLYDNIHVHLNLLTPNYNEYSELSEFLFAKHIKIANFSNYLKNKSSYIDLYKNQIDENNKIILELEKYIKKNCNHDIQLDEIDIGIEKSKQIRFCAKCNLSL
jgi:hypothetical protein